MHTLSKLIHRYVETMDGNEKKPGLRALGETHRYSLLAIARRPIAQKNAAKLKKGDWIDYAKERRELVGAATVNQEVTYSDGVLKFCASYFSDCEDVNSGAIAAAKPTLSKLGLIGKSTPRDRRPTNDELDSLIAYFEKQNDHPVTKVNMVQITNWQVESGRRLGESCRLLWSDWNREDHTILVRKMKDPKNRDKNKVVALPEKAQAMLVSLWETRNPSEPRIFPFNKRSASHRYTQAKHALGIKNLRLHDSRRECGSRLVESGFTAAEAIQVTGHETTQIFERNYMRFNPALLKNGPASKRQVQPETAAMPDELYATA